MNRTICTILALLSIMTPALSLSVAAASRPVVVVFASVPGEGVDKALADSATKALSNYLRDTHQVDVLLFDRESPTVLRAIMDKSLTADQVAGYASRQERMLVAKALSYEYAASSEVAIKNGIVEVEVWLAKSNGAKKEQWKALGQSSVGGGTGDLSYDNAMQSATSAAVVSVSRQAFLGQPAIDDKPATPEDTTAIGAELIPPPAPPTAGDYAGQAQDSLKSGNIALAIQQYQQAVNADPTNPSLRIKLAEAYAHRAMYNEAASELDKAAQMDADQDQLAAARSQIADLRAGMSPASSPKAVDSQPKSSVVKTPPPSGSTRAADASKDDSKSALAKLRAGDDLWRSAKVDEAAEAYKEAIKLNPADWRAYERLALVNMSMSLYSEARKAVEQLQTIQPKPPAKAMSARYDLFIKVFKQSFAGLLKQYERDADDYRTMRISRESYYTGAKGIGYRVEMMARFLDELSVPEDKKSVNLHLSLACGLASQAASSLQDYLESNNETSKSNADTFISQAKKELDTVRKMETAAEQVQRKPQNAQTQAEEESPTNQQPATQEPAEERIDENPNGSEG